MTAGEPGALSVQDALRRVRAALDGLRVISSASALPEGAWAPGAVRHLDESQRAMVAARLATMKQGARTDLAPIGASSQPEAADQLNVSLRNVQRARVVLNSGSL